MNLNRIGVCSRRFFITMFTLLFVIFFNYQSNAVPAYHGIIIFSQPDGSTLRVRMMGDERIRWAETEDYYTLLFNTEGFLVYAAKDEKGDLIATDVIAHDIGQRNAKERALISQTQKSLRYSDYQVKILTELFAQHDKSDKAFVPLGNKRLIMILVAYTDRAFTRTQAEFNNLMNQLGYNLGGAQGSVKDYFLENSYGAFNLTTDVVGPFTLSQNMAYYGANVGGFDVRPREMVTEAVNLANPIVNFANYDNDSDGTVDGVYVIYAGYGEEAGGGANCIWAHAWAIPTINRDGVNINRYSCSAELRGNTGTNISTIGVICHEFGHICGAPDYYDTNYGTGGQYTGTGNWDLMAGGSWNGINAAGDCPAHINGYEKWLFGWANPVLLSVQQQVTMLNSAFNDDFYYFTTTTPGEFFYCENRQLTGFDRAIPGHGLIIYHVDEPFIATAGNLINAGSHQGMYPVCANAAGNPPAVYGTINGGGCPYPGTGNRTSFTDISTPHSRSWAGDNTGKPLTSITESAGVISFCFISCSPGDPINLTASAISDSQINVTWNLNSANDPVLLVYNTSPVFGVPVNGTTYTPGQTIPGGGTVIYYGTNVSFSHSSLTPNTRYYYKAFSSLAGNNYTPGVTADATTFCSAITLFPYNQGFENGGTIPPCWSQSVVSGGLNWMFRAGSGSGSPAVPRTGSYNANFYEGAYGTVNTSKLIAPRMNISALTTPQLVFWYTNRFWSPDQDILRIYYKTSAAGPWTLLATYNSDVPVWSQVSINLPNKSSDYWIAFEATENYAYGICIDDVIVHDASSLPVEISNFDYSCINNDLFVEWTTSSEINSDYFSVQGSYDGKIFFSEGIVNASGNSNTDISYSYIIQSSDYNFVRLTQTDYDGETFVYQTVPVYCQNFSNSVVQLKPNVINDYCSLFFDNTSGVFSIELFDHYGNSASLFENLSVSGMSEHKINLSFLPSGVYYIKVVEINSADTQVLKLIKL